MRVYFRCCRCGVLRPLSRTGNKHNNRTKRAKGSRCGSVSGGSQFKLFPWWSIGVVGRE